MCKLLVVPQWLTVTPKMVRPVGTLEFAKLHDAEIILNIQGIILPNESITLTLTAYIHNELAQTFNLGMDHLQETIILRTERGRDHFVILSGAYRALQFTLNECEKL